MAGKKFYDFRGFQNVSFYIFSRFKKLFQKRQIYTFIYMSFYAFLAGFQMVIFRQKMAFSPKKSIFTFLLKMVFLNL